MVAGTDLFKGNVQNNEEVQRLCAKITITDLTRDGTNFVSCHDFEQKTNISYTVEQYSNIQKAVKDSWSLIKKNQLDDNGDNRGVSTCEFLNRFKKGSKNFRKILDGTETSKIRIDKNQRVKTFLDYVDYLYRKPIIWKNCMRNGQLVLTQLNCGTSHSNLEIIYWV
jgi:hypothetical protein